MKVVDHQDGSYSVSWETETAGTYQIGVTIGKVHVAGSPTTLKMVAGPPDVGKVRVHRASDGMDMHAAQAVGGRASLMKGEA